MRKETPISTIESIGRPTVTIREETRLGRFSEISESIRGSVLTGSKCDLFAMIVKSLILLSVLSVSFGDSSFQKCCPPGLVFSGSSKVDCVEAPLATELLSLESSNDNATFEFPICDKPEHIATTLLPDLSPTDFLQVGQDRSVSRS